MPIDPGTTNTGNEAVPETLDSALGDYLGPLLPYTLYAGYVTELSALPAYSYFQTEEEQQYTLQGNATGYVVATYQVNIFALQYNDAALMMGSLRDALNGFRGYMGSIRVWNSRLSNSQNPVHENVDGSGVWIWNGIAEYRIHYKGFVPQF